MRYTIKTAKIEDCKSIANLLKDNFLNFEPYKNSLSDKEKEGYIFLNTEERLKSKFKNGEYLMNKVMLDENGNIIGYRGAKLENIILNNKEITVLAGKRLHIDKKYANTGLYSKRLDETFDFIKEYNQNNTKKATHITGVPSNDFINKLYLDYGFEQIATHTTNSLKESGISKTVPLMLKEI